MSLATSGDGRFRGGPARADACAPRSREIADDFGKAQAVFASKLACEATGKLAPAYSTGEGSRRALAADPDFAAAFLTAKTRVRAMDYRCGEETDQTRQALLELYCAIVLGCPFNTH